MTAICFWCEQTFNEDVLIVYTVEVQLCPNCNRNLPPTFDQIRHKLDTDPLIYAMEQVYEPQP